MNYYIFRHGETYFSKNKIPYGKYEDSAEILPEGIPTIEKLATYLKNIEINKNFSSPYLRCKQTSEIVKNITGREFVFEDRLHEFRQESIKNMETRIRNFLKDLNVMDLNNVSICTHGYPIAMLTDLITRNKFSINNLNNYPACGVLVVIKKGNVQMIDFNS